MYLETKDKITYSPSITGTVTGFIRGYVTNVVYRYSRGKFLGVEFGYEYVNESGDALMVGSDFLESSEVDSLGTMVSSLIDVDLSESIEQEYKFILGVMSVMAS